MTDPASGRRPPTPDRFPADDERAATVRRDAAAAKPPAATVGDLAPRPPQDVEPLIVDELEALAVLPPRHTPPRGT